MHLADHGRCCMHPALAGSYHHSVVQLVCKDYVSISAKSSMGSNTTLQVYLREPQSSIDRLVPSMGSDTTLQDVAGAYLYQKGVDGDGKGSNPD